MARGPLFDEGAGLNGGEAPVVDGAPAIGGVPDGYVQVHVLADRWRVTEQTIRNYIRGAYNVPKMPAVLDSRGWAWLDPTACERWKAANRPGHVGRGGARVGAGKKRRAMARRMGRVPVGDGTLAGELARVEEDRENGRGLPPPISLRSITSPAGAGEGAEDSLQPKYEDLHPTQKAKIDLDRAKLRELEHNLAVEQGKRLDRDEVVTAVRGAFESARERMERRAARVAPVLMARLGLDPSARAIIESVLLLDDEETVRELAGAMEIGGAKVEGEGEGDGGGSGGGGGGGGGGDE